MKTAACGTFDLACQGGEAIGSAFDEIVDSAAQGAADFVVNASAWWIRTDSVDPTDSAVLVAQGATHGLTALILVASVLVQAIRLVLSRKAEPLVMVATGLVRFALVSAVGLTVLQSALKAGDAIASGLLDGAADNFALLMKDLLLHHPDNAFVVLLLSILTAVLALVQWVLMAVRQAGLLVLAAVLPLAASGSLNRSTRGWLDKLMAWLIAIVAYKPMAALIYYIGFTYLSSPSSNDPGGISTMVTGLMVLTLAVVAMPVMLKFFSWSGTQIGGGGGGSGVINAAGAAAMSQSYGRSGAVGRAGHTQSSGPGSVATHAAPQGAGTATAAKAGPVGAAVVAGGAIVGGAAQRMTRPPGNENAS
ncbi:MULTISPECIES: hypothetical protein [unclassified Pseudonocardia]|uniref:hypothetical protein n=1 Tax=unclassified Pseudonocardia TaxID=2619320 RepID=UPI00095C4FDB|nr:MULTISPECIES: hypothetical protein [unclassified Pseudonocardia]MBN9103126.1 hypothetical protein [Pseudonocardia sp.]OJY41600.1 MAG: hypothetical protein BGP03_20605 [Pseudonocardia sp. 73-21]